MRSTNLSTLSSGHPLQAVVLLTQQQLPPQHSKSPIKTSCSCSRHSRQHFLLACSAHGLSCTAGSTAWHCSSLHQAGACHHCLIRCHPFCRVYEDLLDMFQVTYEEHIICSKCKCKEQLPTTRGWSLKMDFGFSEQNLQESVTTQFGPGDTRQHNMQTDCVLAHYLRQTDCSMCYPMPFLWSL